MNKKIEEIKISSVDEFFTQVINSKYHYFRGESNASYFLNSSILRKKNQDINFEKLKDLVSNHHKEYERIISGQHSFSRFLFYIQHSISFSPFIDLTKSPWIALSFVLEDIQRNSDSNIETNGTIYGIRLHDKIVDNPIILSTHEKIENVLKKLDLSKTKKAIIKPYIINPTDLSILNDRMQYQQGAFLLLENDSLNHNSVYNQENVTIVKYIITKQLLKELFFTLREQHPQHTIKYLYDPYRWFRNI